MRPAFFRHQVLDANIGITGRSPTPGTSGQTTDPLASISRALKELATESIQGGESGLTRVHKYPTGQVGSVHFCFPSPANLLSFGDPSPNAGASSSGVGGGLSGMEMMTLPHPDRFLGDLPGL